MFVTKRVLPIIDKREIRSYKIKKLDPKTNKEIKKNYFELKKKLLNMLCFTFFIFFNYLTNFHFYIPKSTFMNKLVEYMLYIND